MTKKDKAALDLAMKIASRDPSRKEQLDTFLNGKANPHGGWFISPLIELYCSHGNRSQTCHTSN